MKPTTMNFRHGISILLIYCLLLLHGSLFAADLTLQIAQAEGIPGSEVLVEVKAYNFNEILSIQSSILFDPAVADFIEATSFGLPGLFNANFANPDSGEITFSWDDGSLAGVSVADETVVFVLKFLITGTVGEQTVLNFSNSPTEFEFKDKDNNDVPFILTSGSIAVIECLLNSDCDNADPCTEGICNNGECSFQQVTCPSGSVCNLGNCEPCPFGYIEMNGECSPCPAGSFNDIEGAIECSLCPAGTYSDIIGAASCTTCAAGSVTVDEGSTECVPCQPGTYADGNQCINCPSGTFSDTQGLTECLQCPPNSGSNNSFTGCVCNPGFEENPNGDCVPITECIIDGNCTEEELVCGEFGTGCEGEYFASSLTIVMPDSLGDYELVDIQILSIDGLPDGVTYNCNPSSCIYLSGNTGCILIYGTPTESGVFPINITNRIRVRVNLGFTSIIVSTDSASYVGDMLIEEKDCNGECGGTAAIDGCGICSGGNTGILPDCDDGDPCTEDICDNGTCIYIDNCCTEHTISMTSGWNTISAYVIPDQPNIADVFSGITSDIQLVKNNAGQTYIPAFSINNIGNWDVTQGYNVKTSAATTLTIGCTEADPSTPISLSANWNTIGYLNATPMDVATAFSPLGASVLLVKNNAGQTYIPAFSINNIGSLQPGQGYQVKMASAATLVYPAARLSSAVSESYREQKRTTFFSPPVNTGTNATIIFPQGALDESYAAGDEIAVLTQAGTVAGVAVVEEGAFALTVWGDDATNSNITEGMKEQEEFRFVYWKKDSNAARDVIYNITEGPVHYVSNGISIIETAQKEEGPAEENQFTGIGPDEDISFTCIPNPTSGKIYFNFFLKEISFLQINFYHISGKLILHHPETKLMNGSSNIEMDLSGFAQGQYFYQVVSEKSVHEGKVILLNE